MQTYHSFSKIVIWLSACNLWPGNPRPSAAGLIWFFIPSLQHSISNIFSLGNFLLPVAPTLICLCSFYFFRFTVSIMHTQFFFKLSAPCKSPHQMMASRLHFVLPQLPFPSCILLASPDVKFNEVPKYLLSFCYSVKPCQIRPITSTSS